MMKSDWFGLAACMAAVTFPMVVVLLAEIVLAWSR
jgi:hypothetical protein